MLKKNLGGGTKNPLPPRIIMTLSCVTAISARPLTIMTFLGIIPSWWALLSKWEATLHCKTMTHFLHKNNKW